MPLPVIPTYAEPEIVTGSFTVADVGALVRYQPTRIYFDVRFLPPTGWGTVTAVRSDIFWNVRVLWTTAPTNDDTLFLDETGEAWHAGVDLLKAVPHGYVTGDNAPVVYDENVRTCGANGAWVVKK